MLAKLIWSKKHMWDSSYAEVLKVSSSDSVGRDCPIFYVKVKKGYCSNKKGRRRNTAKVNHICDYDSFNCNQIAPWIPRLQTSNSWLERVAPWSQLCICWGVKCRPKLHTCPPHPLKDYFFSCSYLPRQNRCAKNRGKTPKNGKHLLNLSGQLRWSGTVQFHLSRIIGLHSSTSASFRFTRQSSHRIG